MKIKNTYDIESHNGMTRIHDSEVKNIAECTLLYDIINPPKRTKN